MSQAEDVPAGPAACSRVALGGEIDIGTVGDCLAEVKATIAGCPEECVEIDLSGVTFMGSVGIGMMLEIRAAAAAAGKQLRICGTPDRVRRVFEVAGLVDLLGDG